MNKRPHWKILAIALCCVLFLTACGQKGDLYLPEASVLLSWIG